MNQTEIEKIIKLVERIAEAADRIVPPLHNYSIDKNYPAYIWNPETKELSPVEKISALPLSLLKGIDYQKKIVLENTINFAKGFSANNILLWGARGEGKSSIIKSVVNHIREYEKLDVAIIEVSAKDITSFPHLLNIIEQTEKKFIIFCDDLSFENNESDYKILKSLLEGSIKGHNQNILFYATSNRRHLINRKMSENEENTEIIIGETAEEKISLSDRFGIWLGFYPMDQETFLNCIKEYADHYHITIKEDELFAKAIEWSATRGSRSGRVAFQFILNLAGSQKIKI